MNASARALASTLLGYANQEANPWLDGINTPQGGPDAPLPPAIMFYTPPAAPQMGAGPRGLPTITGRSLTAPDFSPEAANPRLPMMRDWWNN